MNEKVTNKKRLKNDNENDNESDEIIKKKFKKEKKEKKQKKKQDNSDNEIEIKEKKVPKEKKEKKKQENSDNEPEIKENNETKENKVNEEIVQETLIYNDIEDMNRIDIKKLPWVELIKDKFSNIIWSKNIKETPIIIVIFTKEECDSFLEILSTIYHQELSIKQASSSSSSRIVIGFDTEGKIPYSIQISTKTISTVIYIKSIGGLTDSLAKLLQDKSIIKSGVGVKNDFDQLQQIYDIKCQSALDVACVSFRNGLTNNYLSLDVLAIDLLHSEKYKYNRAIGGDIQPNKLNEWIESTKSRIHKNKYASIDAWLGYKIAETLYTNLKNDSSFFDWSKSNVTGNFQFKDKSDTSSSSSSSSTNSSKQTTFSENYQHNYFPNSNKPSKPIINNTSSDTSTTTTTTTPTASFTYKNEKNEKKYEKANNHENLLKLQQIKKSTSKRPFI